MSWSGITKIKIRRLHWENGDWYGYGHCLICKEETPFKLHAGHANREKKDLFLSVSKNPEWIVSCTRCYGEYGIEPFISPLKRLARRFE